MATAQQSLGGVRRGRVRIGITRASALKETRETGVPGGWSGSDTVRQLPHIRGVSGSVTLPGSKSLSNRVLLLAALSENACTVENILDSEDVRAMVHALSSLGISLQAHWPSARVDVLGCNGVLAPGGSDASSAVPLSLGNAGTAMRPLCAAIAAAGTGSYRLDGVERMRERPIQGLVDALTQLGCFAECSLGTGCPPVDLHACGLDGSSVQVDGSVSSQYVTALLMASRLAQSDVSIDVVNGLISKPYIDMTAQLMRRFGADVRAADESLERWHVRAGKYTAPERAFVEGDASSASYFLGMAAIAGGTVRVDGCGSESLQGDVRFADVLGKMGCSVTWHANSIEIYSPPDDVLRGVDEDCGDIPDAAMTLAVVALFADSPTRIRNVASWRVKETERMHALGREICKLGGTLNEIGEGECVICPAKRLQFATIDTYNDHRMAMAFSLAAASYEGVAIRDPDCVGKTFPTFFATLESVCTTKW